MSQLETMKKLVDLLNQYCHEYYNLGKPTVPNHIYDMLYDDLLALEMETGVILANSPTQRAGYPIVEGLPEANHETPLLSLDKTKSMEEIIGFMSGKETLLSLKLDGLTTELVYENGTLIRVSTRGDGWIGEDITHNKSAIIGIPQSIPLKETIVVVGEAYIANDDFEKVQKAYCDAGKEVPENSRNLAAGSVRSYDSQKCAERYVRFSAFSLVKGAEILSASNSKALVLDALEQLGFSVVPFYLLAGKESKDIILDKVGYLKEFHTNIPIDGIVFSYDDISYSRSLGYTNHHYRDGLAYKFEDSLYQTKLLDIVWQPARNGKLSPVAIFDPITIDGCTVQKATLHNLTNVQRLGLAPGSEILVSKRNQIIPHVEENLTPVLESDWMKGPETCPSCGSKTSIETSPFGEVPTKDVYCHNPLCGERMIRQLLHFVSAKALDVENLSKETIRIFYEEGFLTKPLDLFCLDQYQEAIIALPGFGEKSWQRIWDSIQKSKKIPPERLLVALDIPLVGRHASKVLCDAFDGNLYSFEAALHGKYDFSQLEGIGTILSENIEQWFFSLDNNGNRIPNIENWEFYHQLKGAVTIMSTEKKEAQANLFAGKTIVVTGTLQHFTRAEIEDKIRELGGKPSGAVSSKTDYLIAGEKAGSKLDKAKSFGVTVLTESEFLAQCS